MDKYTKAVLATVALCVLTLPVRAESGDDEKVYYCQMLRFIVLDESGQIIDRERTRFSFKVKGTHVIFSERSFFGKNEMKITENLTLIEQFKADTAGRSLNFRKGIFQWASAVWPAAIIATCDEF